MAEPARRASVGASSLTDIDVHPPPPYRLTEQKEPLLASAGNDDKEDRDVEAGVPAVPLEPTAANTGAEYSVTTSRKLFHLGYYFLLNLGLTIYNKAVLRGFHYPWLLTTVHCFFVTVGCFVLLQCGLFKLTKLDLKQQLILAAFSCLFTINIAISNVSLAAVSVPFHQTARSMTPVVTVAIYYFFYNRSYAQATYLSLVPVIVGVALATYGDYYFTVNGALLTFLGMALASVKTVASNRIMTGDLKLPPMEILLRMSPLAAAQSLAYSWMTGESGAFIEYAKSGSFSRSMMLAIAFNGFLAFCLNISSFSANRSAGALTLCVAANIKQCLTILLGIVLFNVRVTPINGLGMVVTLLGAALYSKVELDSKGRR